MQSYGTDIAVSSRSSTNSHNLTLILLIVFSHFILLSCRLFFPYFFFGEITEKASRFDEQSPQAGHEIR